MKGNKKSVCEDLYWPEILKESTSRFYNLSILYYISQDVYLFSCWMVCIFSFYKDA